MNNVTVRLLVKGAVSTIMAATLATSSASASMEDHGNSAALCAVNNPQDVDKIRFYSTRVQNISNDQVWLTCPVALDGTPSGENVVMHIKLQHNSGLGIQLRARTFYDYGTVEEYTTGTATGNGNTYWQSGNYEGESGTTQYATLSVHLGPGDRVYGYEVRY